MLLVKQQYKINPTEEVYLVSSVSFSSGDAAGQEDLVLAQMELNGKDEFFSHSDRSCPVAQGVVMGCPVGRDPFSL